MVATFKPDTRSEGQVLLSCLRRVARDPEGLTYELQHFPSGNYWRIRHMADGARTLPIHSDELQEALGAWDELIQERLDGRWFL